VETSGRTPGMIIDLPLPADPRLIDVDLIPEGDRYDAPSRISSLVSVSAPVVGPLDIDKAARNYPHLSAYLQQRRHTHELKTLSIACSFASRSHPLLRAAIVISLTRDDQATDHTPIAWCLQPDRVDKPVRTLPTKLSFDIAVPPKAKVEVGPAQEDPNRERYVILAHGEGTATPEWLFRRMSKHDFDGTHWLGMIVLLPRKTPVTADIALTATIRDKKLGVIPCSADLPQLVNPFPLTPA
jgi:hypothetical protein